MSVASYKCQLQVMCQTLVIRVNSWSKVSIASYECPLLVISVNCQLLNVNRIFFLGTLDDTYKPPYCCLRKAFVFYGRVCSICACNIFYERARFLGKVLLGFWRKIRSFTFVQKTITCTGPHYNFK